MENGIKLAEALAWPVAASIIAVVALIIVWRVTSSAGDLSFNVKDWFKLDRKASSAASEMRTEIVPIQTESIDDTPTSVQTLAEVAEEDVSKKRDLFWLFDDAVQLAESFDRFKETSSYRDDPDFWESLYVDRRRELSLGDEGPELRNLADANVTWVWPLIFLIRRFMRLHDANRAEQTLNEAIARHNSDKHHWVLREGVSFYNDLFGTERALEFCRRQLISGTTDRETSAMFDKLAEVSGSDEDTFSRAILREIVVNYDASNKNALFNLAYSYGNISETKIIAYQRYAELGTGDKRWQSSPNNMGVAIGNAEESVQNEYFEQALKLGSGIAAANLARSLAEKGYVTRAEMILEAVDDSSCDAVDMAALLDARSKVSNARSTLEKARTSFGQHAKEQDRKYRALLFAAFDFFKDHGSAENGSFCSDDKTFTLVTDPEGATCTYKLGDITLSGRLDKKPLCYEGRISGGSGGILNYTFKRVLILQVSQDTVRAIIWNDAIKEQDAMRIVTLAKVENIGASATVLPMLTVDQGIAAALSGFSAQP
ncbi:hypothetical protein [Sphingobium vermicomposti]|uniref:Uncharacterized protein n=1 Tax=Sphingobium vermicomposti TaxID=529005 RepID=A0A846M0G2_9SPHN|nr:hypothetical protein [Sphingobium vermicomposti]NIJ15153.1 hypothetical protein [Sphingobium vermicomposti]